MAETSSPTDWTQLREFAGVDLERSFVLSWEMTSEMLHIDVDMFLTPEHPFYEKPRPAEKACFRPAVVEFPFCDAIKGKGIPAGAPPSAAVPRITHGAIQGFRRLADGRFEIEGVFGVVLIDAERPFIRFKST